MKRNVLAVGQSETYDSTTGVGQELKVETNTGRSALCRKVIKTNNEPVRTGIVGGFRI